MNIKWLQLLPMILNNIDLLAYLLLLTLLGIFKSWLMASTKQGTLYMLVYVVLFFLPQVIFLFLLF